MATQNRHCALSNRDQALKYDINNGGQEQHVVCAAQNMYHETKIMVLDFVNVKKVSY